MRWSDGSPLRVHRFASLAHLHSGRRSLVVVAHLIIDRPQSMKNTTPLLNVVFAAIIASSCSKHSNSTGDVKQLEEENTKLRRELAATSAPKPAPSLSGSQPDRQQIWNDCAAFVKSTRFFDGGDNGPQRELLLFDDAQIDGVSTSGSTCMVAVRVRTRYNPNARFDPQKGGSMEGGLTNWIPREIRYGERPTSQQTFNVRISYRHYDTGWRAEGFN
jgi:hypothetical protein